MCLNKIKRLQSLATKGSRTLLERWKSPLLPKNELPGPLAGNKPPVPVGLLGVGHCQLPSPSVNLQPLPPATPERVLTPGPASSVLLFSRVCSPSSPLSRCINTTNSGLRAKKVPFSCCPQTQAENLLHPGALHLPLIHK